MTRRLFLCLISLSITIVCAVTARAEVGYDGGFYMTSDDDQFKLRINGNIQPRLFYERSKSKQLPSDPVEKSQVISFSIRRANISFRSWVGENITFGLGMYHSTRGANDPNGNFLRVTGGTVTYAVAPEFAVTAGMVGLPLDMMSEFSSAWLLLTEAPGTANRDDGLAAIGDVARPSFGVPDGLGLNFSGDVWKLFYSVSVVNGAESNYNFNTSRKMSAGLRFGVNILDPVGGSMTDFECSTTPKLTVSMGTMYQGKRNDTNTNGVIKYLWTSSAGVALRWAGFSLTSEGYYRRMKMSVLPTATTGGTPIGVTPRWSYTDIGYYAALGYYILPKKLEIAAQGAQTFRQGPDNNMNQFGGGLNWYIWENNLKLQVSYTWTQDYDDVWGNESNHIHNGTISFFAIF